MRKRATVLAILITAATASCAYLLFERIKEMGYESCVLSIESEFGKALASDLELSRKLVVTNEWRTLGEEEERVLFDKFIALGRKFDCKQFGEYANGDALREDRGTIDVRRDEQRVHVRIESMTAGLDGFRDVSRPQADRKKGQCVLPAEALDRKFH